MFTVESFYQPVSYHSSFKGPTPFFHVIFSLPLFVQTGSISVEIIFLRNFVSCTDFMEIHSTHTNVSEISLFPFLAPAEWLRGVN